MSAIVIMGGFLAPRQAYSGLQATLADLTGWPVFVVDTLGVEWLAAVTPPGVGHLLTLLRATIQRAAAAGGSITLVAHSAGGVLSRLYLGPLPYQGRQCGGLEYVQHLITLGSPHHSRGRLFHGGPLSRLVQIRYPDAFFAPTVTYSAVAGNWRPGRRGVSPSAQWRDHLYRDLCGDGLAQGDGLVPVKSALLQGAHPIVMEGVSHHSLLGEPWYGSPAVVASWWAAAHE